MSLPNILSLLRICLVPVFPLVYYSGMQNAHIWAALVYTLAAATDVLDGYLARRYDMITRLGRLLDPLADKLMGAVVIICLALTFPSLWWAAALFFAKEAAMGLGALIQYKKIADVPPSAFLGKLAVSCFFVSCCAILILQDALREPTLFLLTQAAIGVSMLVSLAALVHYLLRFIALTRQTRDK